MATPEPTQQITAADLTRWLEDIGRSLLERTEVIAHGGTALTLLGVKESTKDVDFGFRDREDFERFSAVLKDAAYEMRREFSPLPGETYRRWRNQAQVVDVVDLRYPTWNRWRITRTILGRALMIPRGQVVLVRPGVEAAFLFKTYPLRDTDLDDLRKTLQKRELKDDELIELYDEQDRIVRSEFLKDDVIHEPVLSLVEMRARVAASLDLLPRLYSEMIPAFHNHVQSKFEELRLASSLGDLTRLFRDEEIVINWDQILGKLLEEIRSELAIQSSSA